MLSKKQVDWKRVDEAIRSYLGLKHGLVGVKIFNEDNPIDNFPRPEMPMVYCQMLRIASSQGRVFFYEREDEACPIAEIVLGFRESKHADIEPRIKPVKTKKVLVSPLDQMKVEPDVIHIFLTPKQMMGLTAIIGAGKVKGEGFLNAIFRAEYSCSDFTARPFMENRPNISFFCNGARLFAGFRDDELVFGAPSNTYIQLADKIVETIKMKGALCGCLTSDLPKEIVEEFKRIGLSKGTDYFFGRFDGYNIRVYLNKDFGGRYKLITIHYPIKTDSEERAIELIKKLQQSLLSPYSVSRRGNWLDLVAMINTDESGIDLYSGESVKLFINETLNNMGQFLDKAGIRK